MTDDRLSRRALLAGVGTGLVALSAGCGAPGPGGSPTETGVGSPGMTDEESPAETATETEPAMTDTQTGTGTATEVESPTETGTATETGSPTETGTATAVGSPTGATVQVGTVEGAGEVLVGPDGRSLYIFEQDTQDAGESACTGGCAESWPPLTVEGEPTAGEGVTATLSTFERADGTTQVAANGWPLYYYSGDEAAGDANGQGVGGSWWLVAPDGTPIRGTATGTATATG